MAAVMKARIDSFAVTSLFLAKKLAGLAAFERQLGDGARGHYCHGDQPTMTGVCLVPQSFNARRFDARVECYPVLMRIFDVCTALEAFRNAEPSAQPDAANA